MSGRRAPLTQTCCHKSSALLHGMTQHMATVVMLPHMGGVGGGGGVVWVNRAKHRPWRTADSTGPPPNPQAATIFKKKKH